MRWNVVSIAWFFVPLNSFAFLGSNPVQSVRTPTIRSGPNMVFGPSGAQIASEK